MTKVEKYLVWGSTSAVAVSGLAYAALKYLLEPGDAFAVVNSPWQPVLLKVHIVCAPIMVFALGMITMRHIWPHFRKGLAKGRRSGVSSMFILLPMIATGYALQAFSNESWLKWIGWVHLAIGVVFSVAALAHALATRSAPRVVARENIPASSKSA